MHGKRLGVGWRRADGRMVIWRGLESTSVPCHKAKALVEHLL